MLKIGIVGSGIAGLTAAYRLNEAGHQVTIFERQSSLGMAAHEFRDEAMGVRGDVPSRMFNERLWPELFNLYQELGVEVTEVSPTQSLTDAAGKTYLGFSRSYRPDINASLLLDSRSRKILADIQRLHRTANEDLNNGTVESVSLSEYLRGGKYSDDFIYGYLYPTLASTVCTCSYKALDHYPALIIFEALQHLAEKSPLLKTVHGTSDVVQRLSQSIDDVRLSTEVKQISRSEDKVVVAAECLRSGDVEELSFDHMIVATQANQVDKIVSSLSGDERKTLAAFRYENVPVVVHTDSALMPGNKKRWSTFNMLVAEKSSAMCTVWMNQFHADWKIDVDVFQTINPHQMPAPELTLASTRLQRPVVDEQSFAAWQSLARLNEQPDRNLWFCGSYASRGVPLLESGVKSANDALAQIALLCDKC